ncbi:hypothetical protein IEQ34_001617 [Dendrobium chrysotoxum]|uniref:Uncharacterized protein n=1 Tax=Dendrobium chrysotoxum TaxID=161865 RepID=A0AAV7HQJ4_DENCH|nr:hypothetical protein IEQ34_001617 [Dendrobium chrysotoxum]
MASASMRSLTRACLLSLRPPTTIPKAAPAARAPLPSLTTRATPRSSAFRFLAFSRSPVELACCSGYVFPLHTVVAEAKITLLLNFASRSYRALSQANILSGQKRKKKRKQRKKVQVGDVECIFALLEFMPLNRAKAMCLTSETVTPLYIFMFRIINIFIPIDASVQELFSLNAIVLSILESFSIFLYLMHFPLKFDIILYTTLTQDIRTCPTNELIFTLNIQKNIIFNKKKFNNFKAHISQNIIRKGCFPCDRKLCFATNITSLYKKMNYLYLKKKMLLQRSVIISQIIEDYNKLLYFIDKFEKSVIENKNNGFYFKMLRKESFDVIIINHKNENEIRKERVLNTKDALRLC